MHNSNKWFLAHFAKLDVYEDQFNLGLHIKIHRRWGRSL
jgi:hypothetical protein